MSVCLSVYVCVCLCMSVYVCVCMCMYVYVCVCMCMYVYVCVCVCMCMCVYVCVCTYVCRYVRMCVCGYVGMCMYVGMEVCRYVGMYVYVYACCELQLLCDLVAIDMMLLVQRSRCGKDERSHGTCFLGQLQLGTLSQRVVGFVTLGDSLHDCT